MYDFLGSMSTPMWAKLKAFSDIQKADFIHRKKHLEAEYIRMQKYLLKRIPADRDIMEGTQGDYFWRDDCIPKGVLNPGEIVFDQDTLFFMRRIKMAIEKPIKFKKEILEFKIKRVRDSMEQIQFQIEEMSRSIAEFDAKWIATVESMWHSGEHINVNLFPVHAEAYTDRGARLNRSKSVVKKLDGLKENLRHRRPDAIERDKLKPVD